MLPRKLEPNENVGQGITAIHSGVLSYFNKRFIGEGIFSRNGELSVAIDIAIGEDKDQVIRCVVDRLICIYIPTSTQK